MGGIRRIKKQLAGKQVFFTDTGIVFNGLKVALAGDAPKPNMAKVFAQFMTVSISRAKCFNMSDFYKTHFALCEKFKLGKTDILGDMKVDKE